MGKYHSELSTHGLHSPPPSPSKLDSPRQKNSSNHGPASPTMITPTSRGEKRKTRSPSSSGTSQHDQPPTTRQRTDRAKSGEGGCWLALDGLMANMEHMAKMLRSRADLMGDPMVACLVSAQAVMMASTADLISRRAAPVPTTSSFTFSLQIS